jgi:hypothetical protein
MAGNVSKEPGTDRKILILVLMPTVALAIGCSITLFQTFGLAVRTPISSVHPLVYHGTSIPCL